MMFRWYIALLATAWLQVTAADEQHSKIPSLHYRIASALQKTVSDNNSSEPIASDPESKVASSTCYTLTQAVIIHLKDGVNVNQHLDAIEDDKDQPISHFIRMLALTNHALSVAHQVPDEEDDLFTTFEKPKRLDVIAQECQRVPEIIGVTILKENPKGKLCPDTGIYWGLTSNTHSN